MGRAAAKNSPKVPASARYEDDLYAWVQAQVELLRSGQLSEVDAENVAEELSDVGNEQLDKLDSAITVLTQHLLKWDHQPTRRSRSWALSVEEQRRRIRKLLKRNPALKSKLSEALVDGYADGRGRALSETNLPADALPVVCPYNFDDLMNRDITFAAKRAR